MWWDWNYWPMPHFFFGPLFMDRRLRDLHGHDDVDDGGSVTVAARMRWIF
jgi:hypothetical protein